MSTNIGENTHLIKRLYQDFEEGKEVTQPVIMHHPDNRYVEPEPFQDHVEVEESLSLEKKEIDFIKRALLRHDNKRKDAARELGISERTLYRKIKEYDIE
jgi:transcriptional regulator with PAS, ATPase and Fis domain